MDITVKCPNCYQQVSKDNRYCIFCGYDLSGSSDSSPSSPSSGESDPPIIGTVVYDGPQYCPNGHDVTDPSLGFCSICGSLLVNEPSRGSTPAEGPVVETPPPPPRRYSSRKCKCGYVCDDPDLSFCPSCGLPLDDYGATDDPGWLCICGERNSSDMGFCTKCGKPKGWMTPEPDPEPIKLPEKPFIPSGMNPPKDDDLEVKSRYGN